MRLGVGLGPVARSDHVKGLRDAGGARRTHYLEYLADVDERIAARKCEPAHVFIAGEIEDERDNVAGMQPPLANVLLRVTAEVGHG